jgi:hypothetical protein
MKFGSTLRAACALVVLCACDDDITTPPPLDASTGTPVVDSGVATPEDAGSVDSGTPVTPVEAGGLDAGPSVAPLYVGSSRVFDPSGSGSNGYLYAFGSLAKGTAVTLTNALEIEDAWVFGDAKPSFYTAGIFTPTLQRWTVSPSGAFTPGPVLDLSTRGVKGAYSAATVEVYSPTKSYYVDSPSLQVVVWNPADMTFLKTIPLELPTKAGLTGNLDPNIAIRDGKLFVTAYWNSIPSGLTEYGDAGRLYAIDIATDSVVSATDVASTGTLGFGGITGNGTVYYSPWDYHATVRGVFGAPYGVASRAVRVKAGSLTADPVDIDLSALVGGRPAGDLVLLDDTHALIHVWHNELVDATPDNWKEKRFEPGYKWHRWTLGETTAPELPNQQPSTEGGGWKGFDGKTVSYVPDAEYENTTLVELLSDGSTRELLTVPGWTTNFVRAY